MHASPSIITAKATQAPFTTRDFVDSVMRGTSQVMLQNNSYTGVLFLIGLFLNSWVFAAGSLIGTAVSTSTALVLSANKAHIRDGLFGFNGALVGVALLVYLPHSPAVWLCVLLGAAASTIVMIGATKLLNIGRLPALSAPFVLTSWCLILVIMHFDHLSIANQFMRTNLPNANAATASITASSAIHGLFNGIAQVFLQNNIATGIVFTLALLVSSRRATAMALLASLIGMLVAWAAGATEAAIHTGIFGFNNVLTAIAVGSLLFVPNRVSTVYTVLAMVITPVIGIVVSTVMRTFGLPTLTMPFLLTTWLFAMASAHVSAIKRAHDDC